MAKFNWKALGVVAAIATGILSVASSLIDEKNRDAKIKEAVNEELDRRSAEESE